MNKQDAVCGEIKATIIVIYYSRMHEPKLSTLVLGTASIQIIRKIMEY